MSLTSSDELSVSALQSLTPLAGFVPGSVGSLYNLFKAISPDLPVDLSPTPVKSSVPGAEVFHYNFDEGHAGRFSVPDTDGGSVDPKWVLEQPDPARFILKYLTFYDSRGSTVEYITSKPRWWPFGSLNFTNLAAQVNGAAKEGNGAAPEMPEQPVTTSTGPSADPDEAKPDQDTEEPSEEPVEEPEEEPAQQPTEPQPDTEETADPVDPVDDADDTDVLDDTPELTVFVPGLNTVHQPREGETTTVQRLIHYVKILCTVPMSQLHMGTSFDQGTVRINAVNTPLMSMLLNNPLVPDSLRASQEGGEYVWHARQIDRLQAALSKMNIVDTPVKAATRQLLESSGVRGAAPVVIVAYSRGSIEVEAALRKHIDDSVEGGESREAIEARLRKRITVMTVGSATADFPDGPAYIHLAAWTDPLSTTSGVTKTHNASGAGADALFLNCPSPYHADAFDNHNFGAVTGQYLSLVLALSKATGLRDLWEKAQRGEMVEPDNADELIRAMIQMTRGYEWLWTPSAAWKDIPPGALPDPQPAEDLLREHVGDEYVDRVKANFPRD